MGPTVRIRDQIAATDMVPAPMNRTWVRHVVLTKSPSAMP